MGAGPNHGGNSRRWIMRAVEDSLRRLGTDWIDLYQIHRPDPTPTSTRRSSALTPRASGQDAGDRHSTFPAEDIVEPHGSRTTRGSQRFVTEQPPYSILARGIERDVLPTCERYGMGVLAWSPLAGGWLTGRYRRGTERRPASRARRRARSASISSRAGTSASWTPWRRCAVADRPACSLIHLAIAFVLAHPAVTSAIIGPRTMEQLDDCSARADVFLDADVLDRIDEIVPPARTSTRSTTPRSILRWSRLHDDGRPPPGGRGRPPTRTLHHGAGRRRARRRGARRIRVPYRRGSPPMAAANRG